MSRNVDPTGQEQVGMYGTDSREMIKRPGKGTCDSLYISPKDIHCSHVGALIEATGKGVHCALRPVIRCRRGADGDESSAQDIPRNSSVRRERRATVRDKGGKAREVVRERTGNMIAT
jgi:hypothetical protein